MKVVSCQWSVVSFEKYQTLAGAVWKRDKVDKVQNTVRQLEQEKSLRDFMNSL